MKRYSASPCIVHLINAASFRKGGFKKFTGLSFGFCKASSGKGLAILVTHLVPTSHYLSDFGQRLENVNSYICVELRIIVLLAAYCCVQDGLDATLCCSLSFELTYKIENYLTITKFSS